MASNVIPFPRTKIISQIDIAKDVLARLEDKLLTRPVVGAIKLNTPACAMSCPTCNIECAIIPDRIDWWEAEVERLGGWRPVAVA